ncbi:ABC transporter substrate-binding protein [Campylobacter concisus]
MKKLFLVFVFLFGFGGVSLSAKNIVVLDPAVVEMMYMLEAEDQIAAISTLEFGKIWPEDKTEKLKSVGTYTKPNLERIVELKPDLVVTSFHSDGVNADLAKFGINTLTMQANSVDDICKNIEKMGDITGKKERASELVAKIKQDFLKFQNSKLSGKKILGVYAATPLVAFNDASLPGDMFTKFGMKNVAGGLAGAMPIVQNEFILAQNPDFIIVVGMKDGSDFLSQNPVLKATSAAKKSKILNVPSSLVLRGTPRINEAANELFNMLNK